MKNQYFILLILMIGFVGTNDMFAQKAPKQGPYTRNGSTYQMKGGYTNSSSSPKSSSNTSNKTSKKNENHATCAEKKAARQLARMTAVPPVNVPEYFRFGLSAGTSLPFGRYSEYNSSLLGLAKPGGMFGVEAAHTICKHWALYAGTNLYLQPKNTDYQSKMILEKYRNLNAGNTIKIDAANGTYTVWNLMLGIKPQEIAIVKKVSAYGILAGGLLVASSPAANVKVSNNGTTLATYNTKSTGLAFAVQTQVGLQYEFSPKFGMGLFADMMNSKPTFKLSNGEASTKYSQAVQFWNLGVKFNYVLRKEPKSNN